RERLRGGRRRPLLPEIGGEGGHRVVAPPVDEVFGKLPLLFRNGRVALQTLGVDDRVVEARLRAGIEEDRVEHPPAGRGEGGRRFGSPRGSFSPRGPPPWWRGSPRGSRPPPRRSLRRRSRPERRARRR